MSGSAGSPPGSSPATDAAFKGLLDTYPNATATWGFSAYKLNKAYSGNWGTVVRSSDNASKTIGFAPNGKADVATFNSFCAGTNCFVTNLADQLHGLNATQANMAKMPRVIVNGQNSLAVCPQPGSTMTTAYSAIVNTPRVHVFAVVRAAMSDNRYIQPDVPTFSTTGSFTQGVLSITNFNSVIGISGAQGGNYSTFAGVVDNQGGLAGGCAVDSLSGSTLNLMSCEQTANNGPSASANGAALTYYNAVLNGAWITNGPATTDYSTNAYWGVGIGASSDPSPADFIAPRNGSIGYQSEMQSLIGNGMRSLYSVYDYDTFGTQLNYDGIELGQITSGQDITYGSHVGLSLFSNASGGETPSQSCFETMVLFSGTQSNRVAMAQTLMSQGGLILPQAPNTADGFKMQGMYLPGYSGVEGTALGGQRVGPDAHQQTWYAQSGGYVWPSIGYATNINNGSTLYRFIDQQGDSDINITGAERTELSNPAVVAPGQHFSMFYQLNFEQLPNQTGDWCVTAQVHYNDELASSGSPNIVALSCDHGVLQVNINKMVSGSPIATTCGTKITVVPGTTYAFEIEGYWSTNHTSDTLVVHGGTNGSALPVICSTSGALWDNDTGAYMKMGIYRGYPWSNAGTIIERVMNPQFSTTQNAFAGYITTQPPLPTHN